MFSSPLFLTTTIVAFLALVAAIAFQVMEMQSYMMF